MATLKNMTRVGADVRQIARLLQAKAPENHMLAYITPEEAQLLRDRGGSGMPDPQTGVPSFAPAYDYGNTESTVYDFGDVRAEPGPQLNSFIPVAQVDAQAPEQAPQNYFNMGEGRGSYGMQPGQTFEPYGIQPDKTFTQPYLQGQGFQASPNLLYGTPELPKGIDVSRLETPQAPKIPEDIGLMERLSKVTGMNKEALARLGLAGIQTVIGARASRKAAEQGQRGRAETQALAQPYQAKGAELQRQAQAGELTPVARQQLQAAQAQAAQAASARGGVGAQQNAARIEALRGQLLQQQYDYGLKLSGIGDQIYLGAIKTGLQADQVVNQMTNSYYNNIVRTLMPPPNYVIAGQPTPTQR
jgi:hypothetical protein